MENHMSQTGTSTKQQKSDAGVTMNIEVDVIPVSDLERSKQFYQLLGWRLDADDTPAKDVRIVQVRPSKDVARRIFETNFFAVFAHEQAFAPITIVQLFLSHASFFIRASALGLELCWN
jgi:hypothetical protein